MIKLTIDGREVEVEDGLTVLQAARRLDIDIPTLCYHEALEPYGACRVCLVEIVSDKRSKLTASCTYPVWEGLVVRTDSERVVRARKFVVELLLARCPNVAKIRELAEKLGVKEGRLKRAEEDCILCGLCVRVCKMIGNSAISFVNRGTKRVVETPFETASEACIGCGACAFVCPTGAIKIEDIKGYRKLDTWHSELELARCKHCGNHFAPEVELDYLKKKIKGLPEDLFETCQNCRREFLKNNLVGMHKLKKTDLLV